MKDLVQISLDVDPAVEQKARQLAEGLGLSLSDYFQKLILEQGGRSSGENGQPESN